MSPMHPHWQSTDDADGESVRITASPKEKDIDAPLPSSSSLPRASRRPAAFVGILLFVVLGGAMLNVLQTFQHIQADVSSAATVQISANGVSPDPITVQPGQTITWTNNDTIPHILSSDTLMMSDGKPMLTSPIFPASSTHVLIPATTPLGSYTYISKTSQNVSGTIVVAGASIAGHATPPSNEQSSLIPPAPIASQSSSVAPYPSPEASAMFSSSSSFAAMPTSDFTAQVTIPENSHTVGTPQQVAPQTFGTFNQQPPAMNTLRKKPTRETSSGPEVWVTIALSAGAFLFIARKQIRSVQ